MRSSSKVLAHLFSEEYLANAQGFYLPTDSFRTRNGLSSLYSVLPKTFTMQAQRSPASSATGTSSEYIQSDPLEKLAIIVVSSRVSDARRTSEQRRTNIMGEVIGIERLGSGQVRLQILSTFSATPEDSGTVYTAPTVLKDEVEKCRKRGYIHILYIAQSPYSSTLHMTTTQRQEDLFFMSGDVIRFLKEGRSDLKLYPVFFDEYAVVKLQEPKVNSLYIQDVQELSKLVQDTSKKKLVFFNLFNGMALPGKPDERSYRGVMSYTTLLNVYEDVLENADLLFGLIYPGSLKDDILNGLMFLHFSRYEALPRGSIPINFKLDPYESIIGSDSVGPLSVFSHSNSSAQFNSVAFLSHVRRIINVL